MRAQGLAKAPLDTKVQRVASILQLTDKLQLKPGQLSGGQRQRVAIGRSIVREPTIFLFDEPLSNLDAALRGDMRVELNELHKQLNTTMVYVTHDQVEAMTMADRIVVLKDGRVEQFGTPMELYHHPRTRFVASFIGQPNMNFLPETVTKSSATGITVTLPDDVSVDLPLNGTTVSVGDQIEVGLRPEHLRVHNDGQIEVHVNILERLGGLSITYSEIAGTRFCAALDGGVHAEAYSASEVFHGPLQLSTKPLTVLSLNAGDAASQASLKAAENRFAAEGATVLGISSDLSGLDGPANAAALLCQLYPVIHATANRLGLNPDNPRTLKKVTKTT